MKGLIQEGQEKKVSAILSIEESVPTDYVTRSSRGAAGDVAISLMKGDCFAIARNDITGFVGLSDSDTVCKWILISEV